MKNLRLVIDSFKFYTSRLKEEVEKEVEKRISERISDKRMLEMTEKCAISHKKFSKLLKDVEGCVDEVKAIY